MEAGEMKDKRVRYERTDVFVPGIKLIGCELYVVALLSVRRFPSKVLVGLYPCLSSADFSLTYQGLLATPLSFASGCNHDGVITSVRRVASA
jgi:hypothetical protein